MHPRWIESAQSPSRASNRFRNLEGSMRKDASRCDPSRTMPAEMSRHIRSCCNAGIGDEKKSPSGSHGRAGARISNLPPRLSLLCMVVYIKEEPAMQISMLALLGSRTGEARASVGTAPSNRHIQGMTRLDRCAGQDAEAGRPPIGMRVRMLQRDSSCRIRLLCGCRKTCWQHSYYPNDVRIPWDRFA